MVCTFFNGRVPIREPLHGNAIKVADPQRRTQPRDRNHGIILKILRTRSKSLLLLRQTLPKLLLLRRRRLAPQMRSPHRFPKSSDFSLVRLQARCSEFISGWCCCSSHRPADGETSSLERGQGPFGTDHPGGGLGRRNIESRGMAWEVEEEVEVERKLRARGSWTWIFLRMEF